VRRSCTRKVRGSEGLGALWAIASDIRAIRRAQEAICPQQRGGATGSEAQVGEPPSALSYLACMLYDWGFG